MRNIDDYRFRKHGSSRSRAKTEGVSLNTLVLTFIAEGMGRHGGLQAG